MRLSRYYENDFEFLQHHKALRKRLLLANCKMPGSQFFRTSNIHLYLIKIQF